MALEKFKAAPLPNPPVQYDPQYVRQLVRVLELYFSQLDSLTPNQAQSYRADNFYGGAFTGTNVTADNVTTTSLTAVQGQIDLLGVNRIDAQYTDTNALHAHSAEITTIMTDAVYGGRFYGNGQGLLQPYNQFQSTVDQTAASVAVAYPITYNISDFPDGISLQNSSQIKVSAQGIYLFTYSVSLENTTNDRVDVDIWFRKNGTNVPVSNSRFSIPARKATGVFSYLIAVTPFMIDLQANDYIELVWRTSDVGVTIQHLPAVAASPGVTPAIPATPSVLLSAQFVSAQYPPVTRVAPLPVIGFGQIGNVSVSTN